MQNLKTGKLGIAPVAAGMVAVILVAIAMVTGASRQAMASMAIAKKTGQPCAQCHTKVPALNDYGKKYKSSQKK